MSVERSEGVEDLLTEMDLLTLEIVRALNRHGDMKTGELRGVLNRESAVEIDGAAESHRLHYRKDNYLLPAGLIEVETVENDGGTFPSSQWMLTERGETLAEHVNEELSGSQADGDGELYPLQGGGDAESIGQQLAELEDTIAGLEKRVERVEELENRLSRIEDSWIFDAETVRGINAGITGASVAKQFLIREYGEEDYNEMYMKRREVVPSISLSSDGDDDGDR